MDSYSDILWASFLIEWKKIYKIRTIIFWNVYNFLPVELTRQNLHVYQSQTFKLSDNCILRSWIFARFSVLISWAILRISSVFKLSEWFNFGCTECDSGTFSVLIVWLFSLSVAFAYCSICSINELFVAVGFADKLRRRTESSFCTCRYELQSSWLFGRVGGMQIRPIKSKNVTRLL